MRSVCDEFWMVSRGGVSPFDGDLDDYQRYLLDEAKRQRELAKEEAKAADKKKTADAVASPAPAPLPKGATADQVKQWKKELKTVESRIETLNAEGAAMESKLATNPHPTEIAESGKRLKVVNEELKQLEERWLELSTQLEI